MSLLRNLTLVAVVLTMLSCNSGQEQVFDRANSPWVFRSVLDAQPRMLSIGLDDNLWVAYSAETGALYKAWSGGVNFDGAVYTTLHGPQPSTLGKGWMENPYKNPWLITINGKEEQPKVQYKGHRFENEQVWVNYDLILSSGAIISISERPEYRTNEYKQTAFERTFKCNNVPKKTTIQFKALYQNLPSPKSLSTDGAWHLDSISQIAKLHLHAVNLDGKLTLNNNASTTITAFFVDKPLLENQNKIVGAEDEERRPLGFRLIAKNDCVTCHNTFLNTVGPSYINIAKSYINTTDNVAMLTDKVLKGGSGAWGEAAMTAHPDLPPAQATAMVKYIMSLDAEEEAKFASIQTPDGINVDAALAGADVEASDFLPGAVVKAYQIDGNFSSVNQFSNLKEHEFEGLIPEIDFYGGDFGDLDEYFALEITGYLRIPKTSNYTFRLKSDDGSRMYIGDDIVIDNDGFHGDIAIDGEVVLAEGFHPVRILFFQGAGGRVLSLKWRSFDGPAFEVVPNSVLMHRRQNQPKNTKSTLVKALVIPGDKSPLAGVHPSYDLSQARPAGFSPKVGGMDFLSDGRLVISTWDAEGGIYILDGVQTGNPAEISYQKIASGLAEPLGLKVVDDEIYVLQKQELTKLIDHDGDEMIDEYQTVSNDWLVSANFHEFAFGLTYKEPYFYGALAIAIMPGGASANPQIPDRGKAIRIHKETGEMEIISEGLRTPNGIGIGVDNEIFVADNQGDWLPACKIMHVTQGAFFASRAVDSARVAQLPIKQPVVWLPQDEIGNSASTPSYLNDGPYAGQMIHGEVTHGGVKRVFVEKVDGEYQGAVFRFIQGLEAGVNRLVWGPDSALYVGGIGSTGNWQHSGRQWYGLQRLKYNGKSAFEMLAVRAKSNGMEIEFTEPLAEEFGINRDDYDIQQWYYLPTHEYGGPKLGEERLSVQSIHISDDRKKVFLELNGLKPQHLVYIHLPSYWTSQQEQVLWSTEAWYTLNSIPENELGFDNPAPISPPANMLTKREQDAGWKLLFNGQDFDGWHRFGNKPIGNSWKIENDAMTLDITYQNDGSWFAEDGGDIVTEGEYENFELKLEWKIMACGNSGIMYNVVESEGFDYPWLTGPEIQILDNGCHPDGAIETHRAGDLFDMLAGYPLTVRPAGEWNRSKIVIKDGHVEHWLNGYKVVEFTMFNDSWKSMIENSKFRDMADFGKAKKGHICLQDHNDRVSYRNIKIREL